MPLHDHFHPPVSHRIPWEGFHGQWPAVIVHLLGKRLPARYQAMPRVHLGAQAEIDVATFDTDEADHASSSSSNGGVATAVWAPAQPTLAVETELPDTDEYEVRVYDTALRRRLVAAVEIVSPGNKDRPEQRRLFAAKCAALLQQRVSVAIVDLVTPRHFNLYADVLAMLNHDDPSLGDPPPYLYAAACRWRVEGQTRLLETWHYPLTLGQPLPTLPLWLTDSFAVPLELEESYEQTCRDLRIG